MGMLKERLMMRISMSMKMMMKMRIMKRIMMKIISWKKVGTVLMKSKITRVATEMSNLQDQ